MRAALAAANAHIALTAAQVVEQQPAQPITPLAASTTKDSVVVQELQGQLQVQRRQLEAADEQVKALVQHLALRLDAAEFAERRAALLEKQVCAVYVCIRRQHCTATAGLSLHPAAHRMHTLVHRTPMPVTLRCCLRCVCVCLRYPTAGGSSAAACRSARGSCWARHRRRAAAPTWRLPELRRRPQPPKQQPGSARTAGADTGACAGTCRWAASQQIGRACRQFHGSTQQCGQWLQPGCAEGRRAAA